MSAPQIARMWMTDESHVRKVIHDFNEHGFESLRPRFGGGRPRRVSTDDEQRIVAVAGTRPQGLGLSTLTFMQTIRLAYPKRLRIYWIQDGLSSHWTLAIRTSADANNVELVPTPTYASYLNRIEATFGALDEFVCKNADYLDWDAFGYALADHVRHRNSPAERKRRKIEDAKRRERRAAKTAIELRLAA